MPCTYSRYNILLWKRAAYRYMLRLRLWWTISSLYLIKTAAFHGGFISSCFCLRVHKRGSVSKLIFWVLPLYTQSICIAALLMSLKWIAVCHKLASCERSKYCEYFRSLARSSLVDANLAGAYRIQRLSSLSGCNIAFGKIIGGTDTHYLISNKRGCFTGRQLSIGSSQCGTHLSESRYLFLAPRR